MNVKDPINSESGSKLIEREELKGTPFWIIGEPEKGYCLTMGNYKLTPNQKTKEEVLVYMEENKWNIAATMSGIIHDKLKEIEVKEMTEKIKELKLSHTKS